MGKKQPKVGVATFVIRDGKFLVGRRLGSHGHSTWSIPGGHLEFNESLEDAARREVMEESGMKIKNLKQIAVTNDLFKDEDKHYITIWFRADWAKNEPIITEPDKFIEQVWVTLDTLPAPLFQPCWENIFKHNLAKLLS